MTIPRIIAFDEGSSNTLQDPYMIQIRLPGTTLLCTYPKLDHRQKVKVATEPGRIYRLMLSTKKKLAGRIELSRTSRALAVYTAKVGAVHSIEADLKPPLHVRIEPFLQYKSGTRLDYVEQDKKTTYGMLINNFTTHEALYLRHVPTDTHGAWYMDRFISMTSELESRGWFKDVSFSLCHLDLELQNILVGQSASVSDPIVSGILD